MAAQEQKTVARVRSRRLALAALMMLGLGAVVYLSSSLGDPGNGLDTERGPFGRLAHKLSASLGLNSGGVITRGGHLYLRQDVQHVELRSFLESPRGSAASGRNWDPLPAIVDFHRQLQGIGIRLVLLPLPSKATVRNNAGEPVVNEGYNEFLRILESEHLIDVVDVAPLLVEMSAEGPSPFLRGDSHWSPEGMARIARLVAERTSVQLPTTSYETVDRKLSLTGDLGRFRGPEYEDTITTRMVLESNGQLWKPRPHAPYLLLGDSFTEIYSKPDNGWGKGAGFAESLSLEMGAPVDCLSTAHDGAFKTRETLMKHPERLANKSVVVWQFAMRELSFGDWRLLDIPPVKDQLSPGGSASPQPLQGTVLKTAPMPVLTRTPYREAVREIIVTDIRSGSGLVIGPVMLMGLAVRDHLPTGMAQWEDGDQVAIEVVPWASVESVQGRLQRFGLPLSDQKLPRFWIK